MKLGAILCWLLRAHKDRRLRKGEMQYNLPETRAQHRICDRCLRVRAVKQRPKK